jgi:threonine/homoserine/homoserine lactone efflux protein
METGLDFWWQGAVLGFAIAAPVGPIGLLCIQRTLNAGQVQGVVSGLGAATADAIYGCIAGFGLTLISTFLVNQQFWLGGIGGLFLFYLGVRTFLTSPATEAAKTQQAGLLNAYGSTLFLTLTNPMTILSFVAIFAGLGLARNNGDYRAAIILVLGVFSGSAAWWLLLSGGVALLRGKLDQTALQWINRIAGMVIVGFGVFTLIHLWL